MAQKNSLSVIYFDKFRLSTSDSMVTLWIHSGDIQEFPETFLNIQDIFRGHSSNIHDTFNLHSEYIHDIFRGHSRTY